MVVTPLYNSVGFNDFAAGQDEKEYFLHFVEAGNEGSCGIKGSCGIEGACGTYGQCGLHGSCGILGVCGIHGYCGIQGHCGIAGVCGLLGTCGVKGPCGLVGVCGILGGCGTYGPCGVKGDVADVAGATASISDNRSHTNISNTFSVSSQFNGDARQVVFYDPTISGLVYDYIRNYDVYRKDELEFNINTFKFNNASGTVTELIGSENIVCDNISNAFTASYYPTNTAATSASISVSHGTLSSLAVEFPLSLSDPTTSEGDDSGAQIEGAAPGSYSNALKLEASNSSGTTKTAYLRCNLYNKVY